MSALPARLLEETATQTSFGGRLSAWTEVATLWVELSPAAARTLAVEDAPDLRLETATAEARDDARVRRGQRLALADEAPWTVTAVEPAQPRPGRMRLRLERTA